MPGEPSKSCGEPSSCLKFLSATPCQAHLLRVDKKPLLQFQRQQTMDLGRVVGLALDVLLHHGFQDRWLDIRTGECPRIKQHLLNVWGESVAIPNPVMAELVPAQKKTLKM